MRGIGRGELVRLGTKGERYDELCGQCWKGKLCVTNSGAVFPCPLSRATDLGDVKSGLSGVLQTAKLTDFRHKVCMMHEDRLDKQRASSEMAMAANNSCLPEDCIPTDCIPITCIPTDCIPISCIPTG